MTKGLLKNVLYFHALFAFLLYILGTLFTITILEYRLKNSHLNRILAGFACIALSVVAFYFVPILLFGTSSIFALQIFGVISMLVVQIFFWFFWFGKEIKAVLPALALAFGLTIALSVLVYFLFTWYMSIVLH